MTQDDLNTTDIRNICEQIADVYRNKMRDADYNPADELMNFNWVTEYNGNLFQLSFLIPQYWYFAENGRGPGRFPPPNAILKWVQYKRLVMTTNNKVLNTNQMVYLISRKIALHGTKGRHLLQQTIDETYDTLVDQLVDAISAIFEKEIEKEFDNI